MKFHFSLTLLLLVFVNSTLLAQEVNYSYFNTSSENLKNFLLENENYMSGGNTEKPYFQGKFKNVYIKFYKAIGVNVTFQIESTEDYSSIVNEIGKQANFRFKYCTDFDEPIVYNYETNGGNKIRFSLEKQQIGVEYPSELSAFMESNSGLTTVFVCLSKQSYAYHTNLKCEGLGNCDSDIAKSNMDEAKKYNYRICEICTHAD